MLERARVLLQQRRPAEAEEIVRGYLLDEPNDAAGQVVLALALFQQDKPDEALRVTEQAIGLAPHWDYVFYVKGTILLDLEKYKGAQECAEQAIALDPEDADNFKLFGHVLAMKKKWKAAIEQLQMGLALDPQHAECRNLLSHCLTQLGEKGLARESLDAGLAQSPMDPYAHVQVGFDSLRRGEAERALQAFEEALRLDPMNDAARTGLVEALKAKNPFYGWILRGFIRLGALPNRTLFAMLVGFYILSKVARNLRETHPDWEWFLQPINGLYLGAVALSWFADSLFDLLLLAHRRGRHALIGAARLKAILFGVSMLLGIGCLSLSFVNGNEDWKWAALFIVVGQIPVIAAFGSRKGGPRFTMTFIACFANGLIGLGLLMQIFSFQFERVVGMPAIVAGGVIAAISSWLGMILMTFKSSAD